jgi:hypothetical protein
MPTPAKEIKQLAARKKRARNGQTKPKTNTLVPDDSIIGTCVSFMWKGNYYQRENRLWLFPMEEVAALGGCRFKNSNTLSVIDKSNIY